MDFFHTRLVTTDPDPAYEFFRGSDLLIATMEGRTNLVNVGELPVEAPTGFSGIKVEIEPPDGKIENGGFIANCIEAAENIRLRLYLEGEGWHTPVVTDKFFFARASYPFFVKPGQMVFVEASFDPTMNLRDNVLVKLVFEHDPDAVVIDHFCNCTTSTLIAMGCRCGGI